MKNIVATSAPKPRSKNARNAAWVYVAFLTVMAVGQLFAFEKFLPLMDSYLLPGGHGTGTLVAGSLVVAEIFALPFLLRMRLSPLMRQVSMYACRLVPVTWSALTVYAILKNETLVNGGILGAVIKVTLDVQLVVSVLLFVLATYCVYGLSSRRR